MNNIANRVHVAALLCGQKILQQHCRVAGAHMMAQANPYTHSTRHHAFPCFRMLKKHWKTHSDIVTANNSHEEGAKHGLKAGLQFKMRATMRPHASHRRNAKSSIMTLCASVSASDIGRSPRSSAVHSTASLSLPVE